MFNEATRKELISIIAEGVAEGMSAMKISSDGAVKSVKKSEILKAAEPSKPDEIEEDDDFAEVEEGPTPEEIKAQKKSEAAKKAAATRKKKAADKKTKAEAKAKEAADAMEVDDEEEEDAFEEGSDAEMIEVPAMDRPEFMSTLKRFASKHPNGEKEGRKLASAVLKENFEVEKFGQLGEENFEDMCSALKNAIKSI